MKKVLKILEFDRILERMSEYTESEPVRKRIMRLPHICDEAYYDDNVNLYRTKLI